MFVICAQCGEERINEKSMVAHIVTAHPEYSLSEAKYHAALWAEDQKDELHAYDKDRREEDKDD